MEWILNVTAMPARGPSIMELTPPKHMMAQHLEVASNGGVTQRVPLDPTPLLI